MSNAFFKIQFLSIGFQIAFLVSIATADEVSDRFRELRKEFNDTTRQIRNAKNKQDRANIVSELKLLPERCVVLAESNPDHPLMPKIIRDAIQVLGSTDSAAMNAWMFDNSQELSSANNVIAKRITEIASRHLMDSVQLTVICDRMRYGYRFEFDSFLEQVATKCKHKNVRGAACLYRAQFLSDRLNMKELAIERNGLKKALASVFGDDYTLKLFAMKREETNQEIERCLQKAIREFPNEKLMNGMAIQDVARPSLYALKNLSIGKKIPEVKGKDQDGVSFSLSGYKGKVILLYFWSEY